VGYSSLGALERLPLDVVKLDRSLLEALDEGGGRAALGAAVELGRALGLEVVAEGIERACQLARRRDLGCRYGQGFLLGHPVTPAAAGALLGLDRREAA
jgi:EAL domain-containing protein (putative c-di-GMP-specific phosphodiesterase class I)